MVYLKITITDTLSFWDEYICDYIFNEKNSKTFSGWYRVPDEWVDRSSLTEERYETFLQYMYGPTWRSGNDDGSKYVLLKFEVHKLDNSEVAGKPWLATKESCNSVGSDGIISRISPDEM